MVKKTKATKIAPQPTATTKIAPLPPPATTKNNIFVRLGGYS